eukprot:evm.model.NODE_1442_length_9136_cov_37.472527.3
MNECPLCRASAGDGLSCAGCVKNTLYYKQQAIAYKKVALRDAYEQAKVVLTARQPIFEEEQAVADLTRRQGEMRRRLQEVGGGVEGEVKEMREVDLTVHKALRDDIAPFSQSSRVVFNSFSLSFPFS